MPSTVDYKSLIGRPIPKSSDPRMQRYAAFRAQGLNMTQAAIEAGFSVGHAYKASTRIEPYAKKSIAQALEAAGVTNERLSEKIVEGLEATKLVGSNDTEVVDYKERREYTKLALEAKGELKTGTNVAVQINFPAGLAERWGSSEE